MRALRYPIVCFVFYAAFLGLIGLLSAVGFELPSLRHLGSARGGLKIASACATFVLLRGAEFAPLGALGAWLVAATPPRLRVGRLIACVALSALSVALLWARSRATPTVTGALLPVLGTLFGYLCGAAFLAEGRTRRVLAIGALLLVCVPLASVCALPVLALSRAAAMDEPAQISTEQRRALIGSLRGRDPRKIPEGETRTVTLRESDLDALLRWLAHAGLRARAKLALEEHGFTAELSVPVPIVERWLNVVAHAKVAFREARFAVDDASLRVGALYLPPWLLTHVLGDALVEIQRDRDLGSIVASVKDLAVSSEQASIRYGHLDVERGLLSRLVWGDEAEREIREGVRSYVDTVLSALATAAPGDARFAAAFTAAFAQAADRSAAASAIEENRNALIALGVVLGHRSLARAVGIRLDDAVRDRAEALRSTTTLRDRADWTRHFTVSAALTVLSDVAPSDAIGVLKEQLDADGGSGFSFADLLADRAGTRFAELATRSAEDAQAMQQRVRAGFRIPDYFPAAEGLPEGLAEADFKARYGGVGAAPYRALAAEIESRIAALPCYVR